jgi:hypothetical protein
MRNKLRCLSLILITFLLCGVQGVVPTLERFTRGIRKGMVSQIGVNSKILILGQKEEWIVDEIGKPEYSMRTPG